RFDLVGEADLRSVRVELVAWKPLAQPRGEVAVEQAPAGVRDEALGRIEVEALLAPSVMTGDKFADARGNLGRTACPNPRGSFGEQTLRVRRVRPAHAAASLFNGADPSSSRMPRTPTPNA